MSPFDSGGSSAPLREAFGMLSVGDIRNRLTALVDEDSVSGPQFARFLEDRFAQAAATGALQERLQSLIEGKAPLVASLPRTLADLIRADLRAFADNMPASFDLRGASVGNLALVGGYLRNNRDINRVLGNLTSAAGIRGIIRPVADSDSHLAVRMSNNRTVVGQHRITSRAGFVSATVTELFAVSSIEDPIPVKVPALLLATTLIKQADLICYPMGSFWTSVAANLLPTGIGQAISESKAKKVYIPSTGRDREQIGMSIATAVTALVNLGRRDAGTAPVSSFIDSVLLDRDRRHYQLHTDEAALARIGVNVLERDLSSSDGSPLLDPDKLAQCLCELAMT